MYSFRQRFVHFLSFLAIFLWSSSSFSLTSFWKTPFTYRDELLAPGKKIYSHPFSQIPGFSLMAQNKFRARSIEQIAARLLRDNLLNPFIELSPAGAVKNTLTATESEEFSFRIRGVKICDFNLRIHRFQDGAIYVIGQIPTPSLYEPPPEGDWPGSEATLNNVSSVWKVNNPGPKVISQEKCFLIRDNELWPVWDMVVESSNLPYHVLADEHQVFKLEEHFFKGVTGTVRAYTNNPNDGKTKDFSMQLTGDGTLSNPYFTTIVPEGITKAESPDNTFIYNANDLRFEEANSFYHASKHLQWFFNHGYEWTGPTPLDIQLHGTIDGDVNNSVYRPATGNESGRPSIHVCDGDGKTLKNLTLDHDVVAHELGHHVLFTRLQTTEGESLIVHEGMADFFVYSDTGSPCLASSICPPDSNGCWTRGKCLRTAEVDFIYTDDIYGKLGEHHQGQLISRMLWDLRKEEKIPADDLSRLTILAATGFLEKASGLRDLILALLNADKSLSNGQYACDIYQAALDKGFSEFVQDIDCQAPDSWPMPSITSDNSPLSQTSNTAAEEHKRTITEYRKCSTLADNSLYRSRDFFAAILLFTAPLFFVFYKKSAKFTKQRRVTLKIK